jgi:hypothetical protein
MNNSFLKKVLRNQNSEMTAKPAQTKSVPGIPAGDSVSAGGIKRLPCRYCAQSETLSKPDDDRNFLTNARAVPARTLAVASIKFKKIIIP